MTLCFLCGREGDLSRCPRVLRADALGWGWLICIIFDAKIVGAAETGFALFKALECAIVNHIAQIYPGAPWIILSFDGGGKSGRRSNNAERKKQKLHPLPTPMSAKRLPAARRRTR
jgi:hypothetical protein